MPSKFFKSTHSLNVARVAAFLLISTWGFTASAQRSVYSTPVGYNSVVVPPSPDGVNTTNIVFSIPLSASPVSAGPITSVDSSTAFSNSAAAWTTNQFTATPFLVKIMTGSNAGRFFQITANTATQLTVNTNGYDLTTLLSVGDTFQVVPTNTFSSLFGTSTTPFFTGDSALASDNLMVWNVNSWLVYYNDGTDWRKGGSLRTQDNAVITPDQGIFMERLGTAPLTLTFMGGVPSTAIKIDLPGPGFVSFANPYPVNTTVGALGVQLLPGWTSGDSALGAGDNLYIWNGTAWSVYFYDGTNWFKGGNLHIQDTAVVPADTVVYVSRSSTASGTSSTLTQSLPYNLLPTDLPPQAQTTYTWSNFAGVPSVTGTADGSGTNARFYAAFALTVDAPGNVYVTDNGLTGGVSNTTIRKITPAGSVTTVAGATSQVFNSLHGIALDSGSNIYVTDVGLISGAIKKVATSGTITTLSLTTTGGGAAPVGTPYGVTLDSGSNIYVADFSYNYLLLATPAGLATNLAGLAGGSGTFADGSGISARFNNPEGIALLSGSALYVADTGNNVVRKITFSPTTVTTLAGLAGSNSLSGDGGAGTDGSGTNARFSNPAGITVDGAGNVFVTDVSKCTVREITPGGLVTTIGGAPVIGSSFLSGTVDGTGTNARFNQPEGIAVDGLGNLYVADDGSRIRKGVLATPYALWRQGVFTSTQLSDPTTSSDLVTPAGDAIPNLMKYALNLSPFADGSSGVPVLGTVTSGSNTYLTFTYTQVISATDVVYGVQVSSDLNTWNSGAGYTGTPSVTNNPDGITQTVVVQDLTPMSALPAHYMRLKVTLP